jgi:hypothetical protein|tara:strand:+ start:981 stop:1415 length:435 start_codon:yes stop_codon:yes gene_type:complete
MDIGIPSILKPSVQNKKYGILLASIMFLWSGLNKIFNFDKKVSTLMKKTALNKLICSSGMIGVILLETIGFMILIEYFFGLEIITRLFTKHIKSKNLVKIILLLLLLFLIVVTLIYHPFNMKHPIPFLSNLTTFGLFLYVYNDM